mgnify:CR=1 FL=1
MYGSTIRGMMPSVKGVEKIKLSDIKEFFKKQYNYFYLLLYLLFVLINNLIVLVFEILSFLPTTSLVPFRSQRKHLVTEMFIPDLVILIVFILK